MHFLLMIADYHEAQQQFAFLEPEKGSNVIRFRTCDLSLFRDRAYVIASALSNMAGFDIVPRSEFLGFSAKCMNMQFRLSIYCIREQSKRLLRRLSFVDLNTIEKDVTLDFHSAKGELSGTTFFDESMSTAINTLPSRYMSTAVTDKLPGNTRLDFSPGPLAPYCSAQIGLSSEELDIEALLAERISDIYQELLNSEKDQSYYEDVVRCLTKHNYETKTSGQEKISSPRIPANIEDTLFLLQNLSRKLQEIPFDAYAFLTQINEPRTLQLKVEEKSTDMAYPEIQIAKLRELHGTRIQPSSANFPLICAGATSLLKTVLSTEALQGIGQSFFLHPHADMPGYVPPSCDYKRHLSDIQSSIKALQAQITSLRMDSSTALSSSSMDTGDIFTRAIFQALEGTMNMSTEASGHTNVENNEIARDSRAIDKERLRMSLRATTRAQETSKFSSRLHKTFSGKSQTIPVSTFVADGVEGRLSNTVYLGDE